VTNASFVLQNAGAGCTPGAITVVSGGGTGTSSVTAVFNIPNTCTTTAPAAPAVNTIAPNGVQVVAPFKVTSVGSVTGTVSFKVVSTDSAYDASGVTGGTTTLVKSATPFTVAVAADTTPTILGLGTSTAAVYSYLKAAVAPATSPDSVLGTFTVGKRAAPTGTAVSTDAPIDVAPAATAKVFADMNRGLLPAITYDATVTASNGNFAVIKPYLNVNTGGAALMTLATSSASTATTLGNASGSAVVTAVITGSNTTSVNSAQSYSATLTPALATNTVVSTPAAATGSLQTIALEGVSFLAPWIGGSLSSSASYIRVSNSGAATGQVTISLLSPNGAASAASAASVCTSATVSKLSSIGANNELVIAPADLTACFGDFTRADVVVTIQATSASLTAKARNVTASSVSELSLGAGTFN
jgi:hypothetical protein